MPNDLTPAAINNLTNTLVGLFGVVKKTYRAMLTQAGTAAPVAVVLENSLGGTVVWSRNFGGDYSATLAGAFPAGKTFIMIGSNSPDVGAPLNVAIHWARISDDVISVTTGDTAGNADDMMTDGTPIEILVYP